MRDCRYHSQPPDIVLPRRCPELIEHGVLVAINHSGGMGSQAMTILLSRVVPREQLLVIHAPLGVVEWEGTTKNIEATVPVESPFILAPATSGKTPPRPDRGARDVPVEFRQMVYVRRETIAD